MSSVRCIQLLGHAVVGHANLFFINLTVGSYLAASLVAHLCCHEGEFLVATLRGYQST